MPRLTKPFANQVSALVLLLIVTLGCSSPMNRQHESEHFSFVYSDAIDPTTIQKIAHTLEGSYGRVSRDLGAVPADSIRVFVYGNRWSYARATGWWTASGNVAGPAELHFLPKGWTQQDHNKVAVHEFAHAVTLQLLLNQDKRLLDRQQLEKKMERFPVWLWEGVACYEAGELNDLRTLPFLAEGRYPSLEELNNRSKGGKIYKVGYTLIEYILHRYGHDKLLELLSREGNLPLVLGVTEPEFERGWYDFVQEKYLQGPAPAG